MIYTDKWAFIHIPKTSGTNLKYNCRMQLKNIQEPYRYALNEKRLLQHSPLHVWEHRVPNRKFIAIVRNPYQRAVSQWLYSLNFDLFLNKFGNVSFKDYWQLTFEGFDWNLNTSQNEFIKSNKNNKVKFFKLETELKDLEDFIKVKLTSTKVNSQPTYNYKDYYDDYAKSLISNLFEEDFKKFNYDIREI